MPCSRARHQPWTPTWRSNDGSTPRAGPNPTRRQSGSHSLWARSAPRGGDWFGSTVVEAARLCDSTEPHQVLSTDLVRALTQHDSAHPFRSLGTRMFKGFSDPVAIAEVKWSPLTDRGIGADFDRDPLRPLGCLDFQQDSSLFREVRDRIMSLLDPRPGQTVLDLGSGHDVIQLAPFVDPGGGRVIGVDKSRVLVEESRDPADAAGVTGVEFRVDSGEALPLDDDSVDAARADRVFQYIPDPARAAAQLVRVVRRGGTIVVSDTDWGASVFDRDDLDLVVRVDDARTATRVSGRIERRPGFAKQAVDSGAVTPEEGARWHAMQLEAARLGTFFPLLVMLVVAGQVPDAV